MFTNAGLRLWLRVIKVACPLKQKRDFSRFFYALNLGSVPDRKENFTFLPIFRILAQFLAKEKSRCEYFVTETV